jgi:hypothetical protein
VGAAHAVAAQFILDGLNAGVLVSGGAKMLLRSRTITADFQTIGAAAKSQSWWHAEGAGFQSAADGDITLSKPMFVISAQSRNCQLF